jgi:hypothetical protein
VNRVLIFPNLENEALVILPLAFSVFSLHEFDKIGQPVHRMHAVALKTQETCPRKTGKDAGLLSANDRMKMSSVPGDDDGAQSICFAHDKWIRGAERYQGTAPGNDMFTITEKLRNGLWNILIE